MAHISSPGEKDEVSEIVGKEFYRNRPSAIPSPLFSVFLSFPLKMAKTNHRLNNDKC